VRVLVEAGAHFPSTSAVTESGRNRTSVRSTKSDRQRIQIRRKAQKASKEASLGTLSTCAPLQRPLHVAAFHKCGTRRSLRTEISQRSWERSMRPGLTRVSSRTVVGNVFQSIYLHADALAATALRFGDSSITRSSWRVDRFLNVVKFNLAKPKLSLLWYPRFFDDGFPELVSSTTVDLTSGETPRRRIRPRAHRSCIARNDAAERPCCRRGCNLPDQGGRQLGLFEVRERLGIKSRGRRDWRASACGSLAISCAGVQDGSAEVWRHRTL